MISQLKQSIDLHSVVESAGVDLDRNGFGLCPLHSERTPSFKVFSDNRFKCFGCGEYGDAIDFVRKLYGLSFPDALKHLGIEQGRITPEMRTEIQRRKAELAKKKAHKKYIADLQNTLLILISATNKATTTFKTITDLEKDGEILQALPWWEYCLELISCGDDEAQNFVLTQFKNEPVVPVKRFFKPEFDHEKWLRKFMDDFFEKRDADEWTIDLHAAGCEESCEEALDAG